MKWICQMLVAWIVLMFLGGCGYRHAEPYTWGFSINTGYKIEQTTPSGKPASVSLDVDPLVNNLIDLGWVKKDEPDDETPE